MIGKVVGGYEALPLITVYSPYFMAASSLEHRAHLINWLLLYLPPVAGLFSRADIHLATAQ